MYLILEEVLVKQAKIIVLSTITYMKVVILSQSSMVVQSKFLIGMGVGEAM